MGNPYADYERNYGKAIEYYKEVVLLNSTYTEIYLDLGLAYADLKRDYNESIKYYKKAIKLSPNSTSAYCDMGFVYRVQGNKKKAMECIKKATKLGDAYSQELLSEFELAW